MEENNVISNKRLNELLQLRGTIKDPRSAEMVRCMNSLIEEMAMKSSFLTVVKKKQNNEKRKESGAETLFEDSDISFETVTSNNGEQFFAVFTDWDNLKKWPSHQDGQVDTLLLSFDDLYTLVKEPMVGFVINPFSDNVILHQEMIQHIKEVKDVHKKGFCEKKIQKDTKVLLGEPSVYPEKMVEAIKDYAKTNKRINAIHLKMMMKENEKSYLFVVDFTGEKQDVFPFIAKAGQPFLSKDYFIDLVSIHEELGQKAADNEPFYIRKKGLFH